ncbi:MAG TPA: DUF3093 family protein [Gemmatimonadales bacterium]
MYSHRQSGARLAWIVLVAAVPLMLVALLAPEMQPAGRVTVVAALLVMMISVWTFSSLTVTVDDTHLRWHFGPGLVRKKVPLADIVSVERTRTSLLSGVGIHLTPRGWLYNVWGRDAVWVRLRGGKQFLLGSDEPDSLAAAIRRSLPAEVRERARRVKDR